MVGWVKMKLSMEVGLSLGHIVLGGDPVPLRRGTAPSPQFLAHVRCGPAAEWIKMPLGMEVGLGLGDCGRWGSSSLPQKGGTAPIFGPCLLWPNAGWIKMPLGMEVGLGQATLC